MRQYLIYNGVSSKDFGLYLTGSGAFNAPERDIDTLEIPGRNGSLTIDNGRYKNITQSYEAFIHRDFRQNAEGVRVWLLSASGYRRLEDTYHPDHFRLARFAGPLEFTVRALCSGAETQLLFDCDPRRFLKSGEVPTTVTDTTVLNNPTRFPALPLLTVYGSGTGTITVSDNIVSFGAIDEYVTLDCEQKDAYKGIENKNATVSLTEFPVLQSGENTISISGGVSRIEITPRWWTL